MPRQLSRDPHPRLTGARWEAALARKGHNVTSHLNESGPCPACGIGAPFAFSVVSFTDGGDVSVNVFPTRDLADAHFDLLADELATRSAEEIESRDRRKADGYVHDHGSEADCEVLEWAHLPGGGLDTGVTVELRYRLAHAKTHCVLPKPATVHKRGHFTMSTGPDTSSPLARLRYHVSGAISRGEAEAIAEIPVVAPAPMSTESDTIYNALMDPADIQTFGIDWDAWTPSLGRLEGEGILAAWVDAAVSEWGGLDASFSFSESGDWWAEACVVDLDLLAAMPPRVRREALGAYGVVLSGDANGFVTLAVMESESEYIDALRALDDAECSADGECEGDGTSGQDRESYSDTQDRDSYTTE